MSTFGFACGDDSGDGGGGTPDSSGGGTADARPGTPDSSPGTPDASAGTPDALTAADFCAQYEDTCGFGDAGKYASSGACTTYYEDHATDTACITCIWEHLDNAGISDTDLHCGHATGTGPCATPCG